jgi:predicted amidohydrolase
MMMDLHTMPETKPNLYLEDISEFGSDSGQGNLLGIQPFMEPTDYASADGFYAKLDGYMATAQRQGWLGPNSIAIFPEYIGTWLVATGEKEALFQATDLAGAMKRMVLSNLPRFLMTLPYAKGRDKIADSLFRMKAKSMARIYQDTFSRLAGDHGVTIVAGSIVLPNPDVKDGMLRVGKGTLQNASLVFQPNGAPYLDIVIKTYVTRDESSFTGGVSPESLPLFDTPAGRLAVLICADSWYPAPYDALTAGEPALFAVPNNEVPGGTWEKPWGGYDPGPMPDDVDGQDVARLTNREAWLKYALAGRMRRTGAAAGMHVFFRGNMWDLSSSGHTIIVDQAETYEAPHVARAALVNYWLAR